MATGKSTVGPLLASSLNVPFYDLDQKVNAQCNHLYQQSISELIESGREDLFREVERLMVHNWMLNLSEGVVSLGGGTLHNENLGKLIARSTRLFVLSAPWSVLKKRIEASDRPLKDSAECLYLERVAGYNLGTSVDVSEGTPQSISDGIARQVVGLNLKGAKRV